MGANLATGGEPSFAEDWEHEENSQIKAKKTSDGRYCNPFKTFEGRTFMDLLKWQSAHLLRNRTEDQSYSEEDLDKNLPIVEPDIEKLNTPPPSDVQLMWIGHASLLVQFDGLSVLTDPVWSDRCGPVGFLGYKRYRRTPYRIDQLPHIDAILISHNHYDHLDVASVSQLVDTFKDVQWFVADGQKEWMEKSGCKNVVELTWWGEYDFKNKNGKTYRFACTPAQHWCKRSPFDTNKALWCSWVVKGPTKSFYFAGDTGYCCAFKQIGHKYGPFSLAAIPIGAYEPNWLMWPQHCNPEQAVTIHEDLKAERSVGIHWGTFQLSAEPYMEPKEKIQTIAREKNMKENTFFTVKHGEVYRLASPEKCML